MSSNGVALSYQTYVKVPQLLTLQEPMSDPEHPEERQFIVAHQAIELWFSVMLQQIERVIAAIDAGEWIAAAALMRRVSDILGTCIQQLRSLHDMPPRSFHEFRGNLGTTSALESIQFRELELISGLRLSHQLKHVERLNGGTLPAALAVRLGQRSLAEAHAEAARRVGITDWAAFYAAPGSHADFYDVCETLLDYDAHWMRWRHEHIILVERLLGTWARGTGGTAAVAFLEQRASSRFFPYLWELRNDLCLRGGGELVPHGH